MPGARLTETGEEGMTGAESLGSDDHEPNDPLDA